MIGYYRMSLIGSSHLSEKDGVCQDSNGVKSLKNGWVIAAIADGVGSAKHSDVGSKLAVEEVLRFIEVNLPELWHNESLTSLLRTAFHSAMRRIIEKAANDKNPVKDYDTTLTTIIYNGTNVVFGHVGDGGILALNHYGDFSILTVAQKGEEFNSVTPLRAGPDKWLFGTSNESIAALLMLTDGIYDVACPWLLAKKTQKIYINYIRPFMDRNILSVKSAADFENVQKEIEEFFKSEHSRQITDDKTLLGIINTDVLPETKPDEYYAEPEWKQISETHREKLYGNNVCVATKPNTPSTEAPIDSLSEASTKDEKVENEKQSEISFANSHELGQQQTKKMPTSENNSFFARFFKKKS